MLKIMQIEEIKKGFSSLKPFPVCDPVRIQTWNLLIRSQMLYSIELRGHSRPDSKRPGAKGGKYTEKI